MNADIISWKVGKIIYKYNDQSDFAYLLKSGEIQIQSKEGKNVGFVNKDEVFGEQSILLNTKRTVTAIASKNSSAVKIPKEHLVEQYNNSPILIKAIIRSAYLRLTNLNSTVKDSLKSYDE